MRKNTNRLCLWDLLIHDSIRFFYGEVEYRTTTEENDNDEIKCVEISTGRVEWFFGEYVPNAYSIVPPTGELSDLKDILVDGEDL